MPLLFILILSLAGCKPSVSNEDSRILDGGLISEMPCGPPCFWGITPGTTSYNEARDILHREGLPCHQWSSFGRVGTSCELPGEGYMRGVGRIGIGLQPSDASVGFVAYGVSLEVDTSDVIALYGPPDALIVNAEGVPEHPSIVPTLVYRDLAMTLSLPPKDGYAYDVTPEDDVIDVSYRGPAEFAYMLSAMETRLQPWNGYGEYEP